MNSFVDEYTNALVALAIISPLIYILLALIFALGLIYLLNKW